LGFDYSILKVNANQISNDLIHLYDKTTLPFDTDEFELYHESYFNVEVPFPRKVDIHYSVLKTLEKQGYKIDADYLERLESKAPKATCGFQSIVYFDDDIILDKEFVKLEFSYYDEVETLIHLGDKPHEITSITLLDDPSAPMDGLQVKFQFHLTPIGKPLSIDTITATLFQSDISNTISQKHYSQEEGPLLTKSKI
jgi:hypothetical protein